MITLATATNPFDLPPTHLPTFTALESSAQHENQLYNAMSLIPEEPTEDVKPSSIIGLADISDGDSKGHSGDDDGSQQGNREYVEDDYERPSSKNTSTGQGASETQDEHESSEKQLSAGQRRRLRIKEKKQKEEAERVVKNEREQGKRVRNARLR